MYEQVMNSTSVYKHGGQFKKNNFPSILPVHVPFASSSILCKQITHMQLFTEIIKVF